MCEEAKHVSLCLHLDQKKRLIQAFYSAQDFRLCWALGCGFESNMSTWVWLSALIAEAPWKRDSASHLAAVIAKQLSGLGRKDRTHLFVPTQCSCTQAFHLHNVLWCKILTTPYIQWYAVKWLTTGSPGKESFNVYHLPISMVQILPPLPISRYSKGLIAGPKNC